MEDLINKLGIDETYSKGISKKLRIYDKVKDNVFPLKHYNYMADLLVLPNTATEITEVRTHKGVLPSKSKSTKKSNKPAYCYLLVIDDLATNNFDIEPLETKTPHEVLQGMENMFKRPYIKKPEASIRVDSGSEFKGEFKKYCYDNSILERVAEPDRHQQMANVERLNRDLGRLINGWLNSQERKLKHAVYDWTPILPILRVDLNKARQRKEGNPYTKEYPEITDKQPLFEVGDIVYHSLMAPKNALGYNQNTKKFREGDIRWSIDEPRKINQVLYYPKNIRYILNGKPNVSFAEWELKRATETTEKYEFKAIIGKRTVGRTTYYRIWFRGELKKDAQWIDKKQLIEDGLEEEMTDYDENH